MLALGLVAVAVRLEPAEAAAQAGLLADAMTKTTDLITRSNLARALAAMTARLEPAEAARQSAQAARLLVDALEMETVIEGARLGEIARLGEVLVALTAQMEPAEAARQSAQVARLLAKALSKANPEAQSGIGEALGMVTTRVEPAEAARLSAQAALLLADVLNGKPASRVAARSGLARALRVVAARMEPDQAARLLASALGKEKDSFAQSQLAQALGSVATRVEPKEIASRSLLATRTVASWLSPLPHLGHAATLLQASQPLPCRFTTQQLVDLLKMPTCVGKARSIILQLLADRYKRPFADVWEFVEWAEKYEPGLDFTTPPKRNLLL
jgi:hypothetical protein